MLNPTPDAGMESIFETTSQMDVQTPTSMALLPVSAPTITPSTIATRNLYKALVQAYESDKIILDTYGDTVTLKRRKEPESASAPQEKATRSTGKSTQGSKSRQMSASESATPEEPMQTTFEMEEPLHPEFETDSRGRCVIPFDHFINNDLEYLRGGASSRKYTTSVTKTNAAD
nr:hypothetical protein [Tanacetum cinerariifolium]